MRTIRRSAAFGLLVSAGLAVPAGAQNVAPNTPVVTEPRVGRVVNPADCHMETDVFVDANPGDTHLCTDWQIVQVSNGQVVWATNCISGVERVHTHLGDGTFSGPLAGQFNLAPETNYRLRVRFRDNSGQAATEWSAWGERDFTTGTLSQVFALQIQDVLGLPSPTLTEPLPGGTQPAVFRLVDTSNQLLLQVSGSATGNTVTNPPPLGAHGSAKATITAGSAALALPEFELRFNDEDNRAREIVFPATSLAPGASRSFWISDNGSTYQTFPADTGPNFAQLLRGAAVPWTTATDFKVERVATGFQMPVSIAFVPNPSTAADAPIYYVGELYGTIKVVKRDGSISDYAIDLLNYDPSGAFPGSGEQGLGSIVVDPTNGDLFATVLYAPNLNNVTIGNPRVVRLTSTNGGRSSNARTIILNMAPEVQGQSHQISNISFGPDNFLYVHMGDGFDAGAAQNLTQFRGKILRLQRNGLPAPGNPYYNLADGISARDYIYASGVRNPFGGAWRASDSSHYMVENGPSVDRMSRLVSGRNYLWDGSDNSMRNFAIYNWDPAAAPVNITFVQPETFAGSGFPAEYQGRAYITQSGATWASG
ncbi:MAG: PQQ-dependent sugar dehydrogenase, partial [Phycisphaerales bacterium]